MLLRKMVHGPKQQEWMKLLQKQWMKLTSIRRKKVCQLYQVSNVFSPLAELKKKPYPLRIDGCGMEKQIPGFCFPSCGMRVEPVGRH